MLKQNHLFVLAIAVTFLLPIGASAETMPADAVPTFAVAQQTYAQAKKKKRPRKLRSNGAKAGKSGSAPARKVKNRGAKKSKGALRKTKNSTGKKVSAKATSSKKLRGAPVPQGTDWRVLVLAGLTLAMSGIAAVLFIKKKNANSHWDDSGSFEDSGLHSIQQVKLKRPAPAKEPKTTVNQTPVPQHSAPQPAAPQQSTPQPPAPTAHVADSKDSSGGGLKGLGKNLMGQAKKAGIKEAAGALGVPTSSIDSAVKAAEGKDSGGGGLKGLGKNLMGQAKSAGIKEAASALGVPTSSIDSAVKAAEGKDSGGGGLKGLGKNLMGQAKKAGIKEAASALGVPTSSIDSAVKAAEGKDSGGGGLKGLGKNLMGQAKKAGIKEAASALGVPTSSIDSAVKAAEGKDSGGGGLKGLGKNLMGQAKKAGIAEAAGAMGVKTSTVNQVVNVAQGKKAGLGSLLGGGALAGLAAGAAGSMFGDSEDDAADLPMQNHDDSAEDESISDLPDISSQADIGDGMDTAGPDAEVESDDESEDEIDLENLDWNGWDSHDLEEFWYEVFVIEDAGMESDEAYEAKVSASGFDSLSHFSAVKDAYLAKHGDDPQMMQAQMNARNRQMKEKMAGAVGANADLMEPIDGVSLEAYAKISAQSTTLAAGDTDGLQALCAQHGVDVDSFKTASQGWMARMGDVTLDPMALAALSTEYAKHFAAAGVGGYGASAQAASHHIGIAGDVGTGPAADAEPCSFERFVQIQTAQGCWAEQGIDVVAMLQEEFDLTPIAWSNIGAYWSQKYLADISLLSQFSEYEEQYRSQYGGGPREDTAEEDAA